MKNPLIDNHNQDLEGMDPARALPIGSAVIAAGVSGDRHTDAQLEKLSIDLSIAPIGSEEEIGLSREELGMLPVPNDVIDTVDGKVIDMRRFGSYLPLTRAEAGGLVMLSKLGFKFIDGRDQAVAAPSPETFQGQAARMGVNVQLVSQGKIGAKDYLSCFKKKMYPVATSSRRYYIHDTQLDHISALILGGEPMVEALSRAAGNVLQTDNIDDMKMASVLIDNFTALVTRLAMPTSVDAATPENTKADMQSYAKNLGITGEDIEKIFNTISLNLPKYTDREPNYVVLNDEHSTNMSWAESMRPVLRRAVNIA